jgi:hypothetical protein
MEDFVKFHEILSPFVDAKAIFHLNECGISENRRKYRAFFKNFVGIL